MSKRARDLYAQRMAARGQVLTIVPPPGGEPSDTELLASIRGMRAKASVLLARAADLETVLQNRKPQ